MSLAVIASALIAAGATGCVPIRPNNEPLAMTVEHDTVVFQWCGKRTVPMRHMAIDYRVYSPDSGIVTAVEGSGDFRLQNGDSFSTVDPPGEMEYLVAKPIPIDGDDITIFVGAGYDRENLSGLMVFFEAEGLESLENGAWLHPSGVVTDTPCK